MEYGCEKSGGLDSYVVSLTESEGASSFEQFQHNIESLSLKIIGQNWSAGEDFTSWKIGSL